MKQKTRTVTAISGGIVAVAAIAAAAATGMTTSAADVPAHADHGHGHASEAHGADNAKVQRDLAQVRRVTARFHDLDAAIEAGYEPDGSTATEPGSSRLRRQPHRGGDGLPLLQRELMAEDAVNLLEPEVLVYATGDDGELELVAVEWAARGPNSNPPGRPNRPPCSAEMHILVPAVGFHIMHAWVWKPNPAGMFADWNPEVSCP